MVTAIGEVLPLAIGIAVSPVPIIAAILMLLSPRARSTSLGFLLGWVAGIIIGVVVFIALSAVLPDRPAGGSAPVAGAIKLALGAGLLLLAVRQWRARPKHGEAAVLPKWMSVIDSMTFAKAVGLGFALSAINPKNLLMAISAGVSIGGERLPRDQVVVVVIVYALLAASTVLVPVLSYLVATKRMTGALRTLREWLATHNAAIMAVLLLVLGVSMIGKGLGNL